jgi:hypothetical protein
MCLSPCRLYYFNSYFLFYFAVYSPLGNCLSVLELYAAAREEMNETAQGTSKC